ncbi:MAG: hypothetical protein HYS38_03770 [Acidobacteria bacterium]|nr:hypothetical protein [Acidobacteriota bacterium]
MLSRSVFQEKKFWVAVGACALAVILGGLWARRSLQRAQVRNLLNEQAGFRSPALEITFPRRVIDNKASDELLQPGVRLGFWTLYRHQGSPDFWEVRLTERGRRLFSVVGNQILATFRIGTREVTKVAELQGSSGSRQVRFRYVWKELHPDLAVLGAAAPAPEREYEGEALLLYENDRWRVLHWSTPELDEAVARFRTLPAAPADGS